MDCYFVSMATLAWWSRCTQGCCSWRVQTKLMSTIIIYLVYPFIITGCTILLLFSWCCHGNMLKRIEHWHMKMAKNLLWSGPLASNFHITVTEQTKAPNLAQRSLLGYLPKLGWVPLSTVTRRHITFIFFQNGRQFQQSHICITSHGPILTMLVSKPTFLG